MRIKKNRDNKPHNNNNILYKVSIIQMTTMKNIKPKPHP